MGHASSRSRTPRRRVVSAWLFIGPALAYFAVFVLYPIFATIYNSFTETLSVQGVAVAHFVGVKNYVALFSDAIFLKSMANTAIWALAGPALEIALALALALQVFHRTPLYRLFRFAWFTPVLVSGVVVALVFRWILDDQWGVLNYALRHVGLGRFALNWLGRTDTPLAIVILVHLWNTFGYSFVMLLSGMSTVKEELLDSARIDGARRGQVNRRIIIPLLLPIVSTVFLLSLLGKMRVFDVAYVLTRGGPLHATETVATYVQLRAFAWKSIDLGYPSAIAVTWFYLAVLVVGLLRRWIERTLEGLTE